MTVKHNFRFARDVWGVMPGILQGPVKKALQIYGCHVIKQKGVWFVDIPRTSSSSIRVELARAYGVPYGKANTVDPSQARLQMLGDHLTAEAMIKLLGRDVWETLFSFAVVRNPWDRMVSLYAYRRLIRSIPAEMSFDHYVRLLADRQRKGEHIFYRPHLWMSAADFVCDAKDELLVTYIGRFEDRATMATDLAQRLNLPAFGVVHTQSAPRTQRDYRAYYTLETRALIAQLYARDIALFGYTFD